MAVRISCYVPLTYKKLRVTAMQHAVFAVLLSAGLAGCIAPVRPMPPLEPIAVPAVQIIPGAILPPDQAARNFITVVNRVEPVAEAYCRQIGRVSNCDFRIVIDDRPGQGVNAFQTLDGQGRPLLAFSIALIAEARNADELAFVMGHEAAHHIRGHIPKARQSAAAGAVLAGVIAAASGAGQAGVQQAQQIGAGVGARSYSKDFELEADALGTEIAFDAGYDPLRGAAYFDRLPDPGDQFLGSHPPNAQRKATVARVMADLRG